MYFEGTFLAKKVAWHPLCMRYLWLLHTAKINYAFLWEKHFLWSQKLAGTCMPPLPGFYVPAVAGMNWSQIDHWCDKWCNTIKWSLAVSAIALWFVFMDMNLMIEFKFLILTFYRLKISHIP
jgi:hypothetical protein